MSSLENRGAVDAAVGVSAQPVDRAGQRIVVRAAIAASIHRGAPLGIKARLRVLGEVAIVRRGAVDVPIVRGIHEELERLVQLLAGEHFLGGSIRRVAVRIRPLHFLSDADSGNRARGGHDHRGHAGQQSTRIFHVLFPFRKS